jgi:hypothetical protein
MVGTVTGIAPLRSMLLDALHRGVDAEFVVLHGARYSDELPYFDELAALAASDPRVEYRPTVSRPTEPRNARWSGDTGYPHRLDGSGCADDPKRPNGQWLRTQSANERGVRGRGWGSPSAAATWSAISQSLNADVKESTR